MTIVVCRRQHQATCTAKLGASSDIVVISKKSSNGQSGGHLALNRTTGLGSASTASTNSEDGASNDSSELNKVEVRTSSSLSQPDEVDLVTGWGGLDEKSRNNNIEGTQRRRPSRDYLDQGSKGIISVGIPPPTVGSMGNYAHVHNSSNFNNKSTNSLSVSQLCNYYFDPGVESLSELIIFQWGKCV